MSRGCTSPERDWSFSNQQSKNAHRDVQGPNWWKILTKGLSSNMSTWQPNTCQQDSSLLSNYSNARYAVACVCLHLTACWITLQCAEIMGNRRLISPKCYPISLVNEWHACLDVKSYLYCAHAHWDINQVCLGFSLFCHYKYWTLLHFHVSEGMSSLLLWKKTFALLC